MSKRSVLRTFAAIAILVAGCEIAAPARVEAPADPAAGEIGFRFAGRGEAALVLPVMINGRGPWDFVLDTGATMTCVDNEIQAQLDLPARRGTFGVGAGIEGTGRLQLARVDSIRVGPARAFDVTVCVLDLQHLEQLGASIHGLVGLNFLREFHVSIDFERNILTLTTPTAP